MFSFCFGTFTQFLHMGKSWQPKMAQDSASGQLCAKGAPLGAIRICNRWERVRQITESLFKKKWELSCCHSLTDRSTGKPDIVNETMTPSFDVFGLILAARALAKPGRTTCHGLTLLSGLSPWILGCPPPSQLPGENQRKSPGP